MCFSALWWGTGWMFRTIFALPAFAILVGCGDAPPPPQSVSLHSKIRDRTLRWEFLVSQQAISPDENIKLIRMPDPAVPSAPNLDVYCLIYTHDRWQKVVIACPGSPPAGI